MTEPASKPQTKAMQPFSARWARWSRSFAGFGVLALGACNESPPPAATGSAAATASSGSMTIEPVTPASASTTPPSAPAEIYPLSDEEVARIVNPGGATEYTGPTGAVEGTIKVSGDPPTMKHFDTLPPECAGAAVVHAPSYRAGTGGTLADVLVGAIGVSGYVRPPRTDKTVWIRNCSIEPTVIDLSIGQRLMVGNEDDKIPYMPQVATKMVVRRVVLKGMPTAPVMLTEPKAFALTWIVGAELAKLAVPSATVFVLPNALHTVTGVDGTFRIGNIPVGKARITAAHLGMPEAFKDVEIKAGEVVKVDLTMTFKAPASASSSSAPSSSSSLKRPLLR